VPWNNHATLPAKRHRWARVFTLAFQKASHLFLTRNREPDLEQPNAIINQRILKIGRLVEEMQRLLP